MKRFLLAIALVFFSTAAHAATVNLFTTQTTCHDYNNGNPITYNCQGSLTFDAQANADNLLMSGRNAVFTVFSATSVAFSIVAGTEPLFTDPYGNCHEICMRYSSDSVGKVTGLDMLFAYTGGIYDVFSRYGYDQNGQYVNYMNAGGVNFWMGRAQWITGGQSDISPIPLPASLPLLLIGLAGLGWVRKRKSPAHF